VAATTLVGQQPGRGAGGAGANPLAAARMAARDAKEAVQLRSISQSLMIWATNNKDLYPLPSQIDLKNNTVKELGEAKDTTANIYSMLVWNGNISTEILISPHETNPGVKDHDTFTYASPPAAVDKNLALWDPSLRADLSGTTVGHLSFAHLQPSGGRKARWASTFNADEALLSTRGPEITSVNVIDSETAEPQYAKADSRTFFFRQGRAGGAAGGGGGGGGAAAKPSWSGTVAFNDSHTELITDHYAPGKKTLTGAWYMNKDKAKRPDMAFYDEPDDAAAVNNYLGIFGKAGAKPGDFVGLWD